MIVPLTEMTFEFPTKYEDTGIEGDNLWRDLLPCKSPKPENTVSDTDGFQWVQDLSECHILEGSICLKARV